MLERMCPHCGAANPIEQQRCQRCQRAVGQPEHQPASVVHHRLPQLPTHWQHTGQVVALGLLSIAAEAGLQWLQRRQQAPLAPRPTDQRLIAAQQRIVEQWSNGQLRQRTIERTVWFDRDR